MLPHKIPTKPKHILGIDPGIATTGFGVIELIKTTPHWITHGVIQTPKQEILASRLENIKKEIHAICKKYAITTAGMEAIFFAKNTKTAINVAHARGVILLTFEELHIPCYEFTPLQMKRTITGFGQADKKQVEYMIQAILKPKKPFKKDDAADALAIALCTCYNLVSLNIRV
ncbi:MAG: crossover junction endodeoxyribonuclease RuvC [Candidatus Kerfeldbacteria bacterium RIFCSPHIGHO2_02_FULL_42_14]|uniref:Crossover junction endodeoxyribonuclease RuvC n=1 Tax=Candidatus Kerfeldbacteria bacterium RIFCSPHIGHO2_02_FULL_42_14 TaxID=1798540 RepID=A0A1G2ARX7_9BACT|nr:MAG: crossover junction endodeoxyribonuclease RuvC [Candidatus Kerfeldbacteria bacterium RIFCSPHIGHO2_02_FULL_42_14]OGY80924.1 MAG: crossover junction endodeoxyribonuclease RuvC [Candidatus Kerfeldbacteria bacterium RIFCSPHIGHO2_12_FULL_42_13]OGY84158.1 MAG: crossover junction endodeoxyribonuclease RuvC [Candidatus Kerfeldbacteria bacterium RIFCSPLOWO2_02_FULL_42_19]OGY87289.1 MAG: crossover junction endodeoxyribonuclease RuvC [Candidatus Kerfeldbacteria bacterium RIFCSPLOWO2_12_FULL_43_9]